MAGSNANNNIKKGPKKKGGSSLQHHSLKQLSSDIQIDSNEDEQDQNESSQQWSQEDDCSNSNLQANGGNDRTRSLNGGNITNYKSPGNQLGSCTFLNVTTQHRPPQYQTTSPRGSTTNSSSINSSISGSLRNCSDISSENSDKPKITRLSNSKRSRNNDHNLVKSKYSSVHTDNVDKKHIELLKVTPNNDKKTVFRLLVCLLINIL